MRLTLHARGPQPADEVWERYAVPARWPEWAPQVSGVDCPDERVRAGSAGVVWGPLGLVAVRFTVTELDERLGTWAWDVELGPVRLSLDHGVRPAGDGTRTWLTIEGPAAAVLGYALPARVSLEMLVRRPV